MTVKRVIAAACGLVLACGLTACASQSDFDEIKASLEKRHFTVLGVGLGNDGKVTAQVSWGKCTGRVEYEDIVSTADSGGTLKLQIPVQGGFDVKDVEIVNPTDANALVAGPYAHCALETPAPSVQK